MPETKYMTAGALSLPPEVSDEILQKAQQASAIMRLASKVTLPGRGVKIPMITSDAEADWVSEGGVKPVSKPGASLKYMEAYKIASIVVFSKEFTRDARSLYDALVRRLPNSISVAFDKTVIGAKVRPGENFDILSSCTAQSLIASVGHSAYNGLVAADTDIAEHDGFLSGFAMSPQARGILLNSTDSTGRPLFNQIDSRDIPTLLSAPVYFNKGMYKAGAAGEGTAPGTPAIVGVAGDWAQCKYGIVNDLTLDLNDKGVVTYVNESEQTVSINLWQQNMVAVLVEASLGFIADTSCFNLLTGATPAS